MLIWTNNYAAKNRVNPDVPQSDPGYTIAAKDMPITTFLPNTNDEEFLVERMEVIIQRILSQHMDYFADCKKDIVWHVLHRFTAESAEKSEIVRNRFSYGTLLLTLLHFR
jgi:hypothetical protein